MQRYIALQPIDEGNARAYNPGDPVHADNVARNGYVIGEQVAEVTDDAEPATEEPPPAGPDWDPGTHTILEVNAYLDEHPDAARRVLNTEWDGRARAGIVHGPHGAPPDVAED